MKPDPFKKGDIFESNNFGKFEILSKINYIFDETGLHEADNSKDAKFSVRFLDTGYIAPTSRSAIKTGGVKDKLLPNVHGVGYLGSEIKISDPEHFMFYLIWAHMLSRCYNPSDKKYNSYGGIGVKVDPNWLSFTNFFNDMKFLPNYELKMKYPDYFQIDKDFLQLNIPKNQRIYSKNTCMFLSNFDNNQIMVRERSKEEGKYFGVTTNHSHSNKEIITSYTTQIALYNQRTAKGHYQIKKLCNFDNELAAASLFNYVYPFINLNTPFHSINILNNINPIPYDELKYYVSKHLSSVWLNDYPDWEYIASAMEAAGDRFTYIYW